MKQFNRYYLLSILFLFGSLAAGNTAKAQSLGTLYNVSYQERSLTLVKGMDLGLALNTMSKQFDVAFVYQNGVVDGEKVSKTISVSNNISAALTKLFKGKQLKFEKVNYKTYGIFLKKEPHTDKEVQIRQETVSGTVTDAQTGKPLIGVSILLVGTSTGTTTNGDGQYSLNVPYLQDSLRFSYIGYKTKEVPIRGRTQIDVALKARTTGLEEMVVVGYGEQKKENVTGSISQIEPQGIKIHSANNTIKTLRGLAPNLNIGVTGHGGEADANASLNIRGIGSLSGSEPYIVIDGVRASQNELASMNPNDIKSVSVLKGTVASAIYGSHAAFGAIVVTTKSGEKNQPPTISYSTNIRLKRRIFVPPSVSSLVYAKYANMALENANSPKWFSDKDLSNMQAYIDGDIPQTLPDPSNSNQWLGIGTGGVPGWRSGYANTNWYDIAYKNLEITQEHNISIKGGTNNVTYYLSGGFLRDPGQLNFGGNNEYYNKYNFTGQISTDVTDWLKVSNITRYTNVINSFPNGLSAGTRGRIYHDIMRFSPLIPYRTPKVTDGQGNVIVPSQLVQMAGVLEKNGFNRYKNSTLVTTFKANLNITNNLNINVDYAFKKHQHHKTLNYKKWPLIGPDGKVSLIRQENNNRISQGYSNINYKSFDVYVKYDKTFFNDHNLNITLGYQQEARSTNAVSASQNDVIVDNLNTLKVATGERLLINNPLSSYASLGIFSRLRYNFKGKYLFEFDGRYDGSSRFAPHHRFVFSPSFGVGYYISEESFWEPILKYVSKFKIRASYGKLGNQNVSRDLYLSNIPIHNELGRTIGIDNPIYTSAPGITSPNITWETVTTKDVGINIGFLDNRLG